MKTKICSKCSIEKELSQFSKKQLGKFGVCSICKPCSNIYKTNLYNQFPWKRTLVDIKQRCKNPKKNTYKYYGGRGIQCFLTEEQIKFLWFRDKAYDMNQPSIDRIDSKGNYCLDNCQFIEWIDNIIKENDERKFCSCK